MFDDTALLKIAFAMVCALFYRRKKVIPLQHRTDSPLIPSHWKILITGATSIHGWPIFTRLAELTAPENLCAIRPPKIARPTGDNIVSLCVTDRKGLARIRDTFAPTHVIHASGVCDLDVCEERPLWAHSINVKGAEAVCAVFGSTSRILCLSTDLIFAGNTPPAGGYRESDTPDPLSVAGKTFAAAETVALQTPHACIIRLGLPLGQSVTGDKGAIDFVASRLRRNLPITLFHDEIRSCISVEAIADVVVRLLASEAEGIFHCGGDVPMSLHEVGELVVKTGGYPPHLLKTISRFEEKNGPPRMGNVSLNSGKVKALLGIEVLR
jgi:dTDP-4-dehydrorhamnose reductase